MNRIDVLIPSESRVETKDFLLAIAKSKLGINDLCYANTTVNGITYSVVYDVDKKSLTVKATELSSGWIYNSDVTKTLLVLNAISDVSGYALINIDEVCSTCHDYSRVCDELASITAKCSELSSKCITDEEWRIITGRRSRKGLSTYALGVEP